MTTYLLALLLFAPQPSEQKQVDTLVAKILRLAASEPAVYGVDSRMRTAEVLTAKYPQLAREALHDAQAELSGIAVPAEREHMRVRLVRALAPLDLEEAERLTQSFPRGTDRDYVAEAYDQLNLYFEKRPDDALRMIYHGLAAGAFRMTSASRQLEDWKAKDPEAATALFAEMLGAFPVESPHSEDVLYLLQQTKQVLKLNRALSVQAIDKALSAATSESLRIPAANDKQAIRERLLRDIASVLNSLDPGLLERYNEQHKELDLPTLAENPPPKEDKKPDNVGPDLSGLPYAEALTRARKLVDLSDRAGALIEISRREELTAQQRTSVALEALSTTAKLPQLDDRLVGLAMISRDFARRGEPANAALAAQLLSENFTKVCDCPSATCKHGDQKFDCLQNVEDFAEYLDEFKTSPESMNLENISLEARLLVLKLHALLTGKLSQ
ncbi:MAG TPA: hypothetical protein VEU96_08355 [Bryobacteraceae bacterium]|nr:hypothetical protein [Bryobacteraceae bacterium]